jgi:hypothetical protein
MNHTFGYNVILNYQIVCLLHQWENHEEHQYLKTKSYNVPHKGNKELQLSPQTQNFLHLGHTQAPTVPIQNKNTMNVGYITNFLKSTTKKKQGIHSTNNKHKTHSLNYHTHTKINKSNHQTLKLTVSH